MPNNPSTDLDNLLKLTPEEVLKLLDKDLDQYINDLLTLFSPWATKEEWNAAKARCLETQTEEELQKVLNEIALYLNQACQ